MIIIRTIYTSSFHTVNDIETIVMQIILESSLAEKIRNNINLNKIHVNKKNDCFVMDAMYNNDLENDNEWYMHTDEISQMRKKILSNNIQYAKERIET